MDLPARLIDLYTYRGDLVLDPFVGSGTAAVAALRTGRHYVGYDLDETYVSLAEARVSVERQRLAEQDAPTWVSDDKDLPARAVREGKAAKEIGRAVLAAAGFADIRADQRQPGDVEVSFTARDEDGALWLFEVCGSFTSYRAGLKRTDILWKALGKAAVLRGASATPLVLLSNRCAHVGERLRAALRQVCGPDKPIFSVIEMLDSSAVYAMKDLCKGEGRL